jgi:ubiquinone biosynthesis monooxygenase Coq6
VTDPNEKATIVLSNGKSISADLVIGADGYKSRVRQLMGSAYLNGNYDRIAIVATLKLIEQTENNIAWQRFLPTGGPIALLPLSSEYSSLVWSTTPENAKHLMSLPEEAFVDEVNSALWKEYPRSTLVQRSCELLTSIQGRKPRLLPPSLSDVVPNSRATFPLGFGHSAYYVNRRVALIGDAAHRVHPLGGQGLNLGLGDVACLLKVLETSVSLGEHLGHLERLKHYETERQRHNVVVQSGIDFLHRLYSFEFSPVVAARSVGLSLVDSSERLKKAIAAQAAA